MLATGTDAIAGRQDWNKIRYADDTLNLCVQGATHWDALGHIFYEDKAYNGHDAKLIDSADWACSGSSTRRAGWPGAACFSILPASGASIGSQDGEGISNDELDKCAQGSECRDQAWRLRDHPHRPDGALPRREQWGGYAGGDAPGVKFENCYWCQAKEIAAICSDTWGVEVRPNETAEANQPWHWVVIPAMGLCMGEIFYLKELAQDCAEDGIYEFFFCGPPLSSPALPGPRSIRRRSNKTKDPIKHAVARIHCLTMSAAATTGRRPAKEPFRL